jgi:polar amino acid transport system substrate-binding protein
MTHSMFPKINPVLNLSRYFQRLAIFAILNLVGQGITYAEGEGNVIGKSANVLVVEQTGDRGQILPLSQTLTQLFAALENAANVKFNVRRYPWRRLLQNGERGEGLIFGIYKTPERSQTFAFSEPVYSDKIWLVTRCADRLIFNDLQDLKGKTIGFTQGSSAGEEFDKQVNVLFKAEYNTSNLASRFLKLHQNRMDAFLLYEPRTNIKEVQKELNQIHAKEIDEYTKKKTDLFCILPKPVAAIDVYFAASLNSDKTTLNMIDKALIQIKKNGELNRIFEK